MAGFCSGWRSRQAYPVGLGCINSARPAEYASLQGESSSRTARRFLAGSLLEHPKSFLAPVSLKGGDDYYPFHGGASLR